MNVQKGNTDILMFKYKFVFTSILTSRNKVRKKCNSILHPVIMTVFPNNALRGVSFL